jgi:hypothetical protein
MDDDALFLDGDPFDDPAWQRTAEMIGALPPPPAGYVTCPLAWLARILPAVRASDQLAVALVLYRQCLMQRSKTVALSNGGLRELGVSRWTKLRALTLLEEAGVLTVEPRNGRSARVTLHWFP